MIVRVTATGIRDVVTAFAKMVRMLRAALMIVQGKYAETVYAPSTNPYPAASLTAENAAMGHAADWKTQLDAQRIVL
jgi:hypothetical protein